MTQYEEIIKELKTHKRGRTDWDLHELGINRPSARLSELKKKGYVFGKQPIRKINKYGRPIVIYRYTLEGEPTKNG